MTDTIRSMTSEELVAVRTDGQFTRVRMVVVPQQVVFSFICSGSLTSNDAVQYVPIGTITGGSSTKVQSGMTCYVGTAPGLSDLGMVRAKSVSSSYLKIARVSGITWSSSVYLTVVDDFGLWAKLPTLDLTTIRMDDDIVYSDQNSNIYPVPIMGPDTVVPYTSGSLAMDASNSYCLSGSITGYSWSVINGSATSGSVVTTGSGVSMATGTFTFPAPGSYVIGLTVTASNGKTATGHRNIYVYNETTYKPLDMLTLRNMSASRDNGGWQAEVNVWDSVGLSTVRDRSKVILVAQDYYNGSAIPMGQVAGRENVLMVGWISNETTEYNKESSTVTLTIQGAQYWLQNIVGPSTFLENVVGTPDAWTSVQNLTMDKIVHHFMYWRSTAIEVMDVYPSNNTRLIGGMSASIGSIWTQMYDTAITRMLSYMGVDRFGRFFIFLDPQILSSGDRSSIPTIIDITQNDLADTVAVTRTIVNPVSLLEVAGLAMSGSAILMYMSRAPGSLIYNRFGENNLNDRLVVTDQADANALAGMLLAKKNNEYDTVNFTLGQNNKMLDIAPAMYFTFTVASGDTIRGFTLTNMKFLIKSIEYSVSEETGAVKVSLEVEGETSGIPGYTVAVPQEPVYNFINTDSGGVDLTFPDMPTLNLPVLDYNPSDFLPFSISGSGCATTAPINGPYNLYPNSMFLTSGSSAIVSTRAYVSGTVRSSAATNPTTLYIYGNFECFNTDLGYWVPEDSGVDTWWFVRGINASGSVVALASITQGDGFRQATFAPAASQQISYIEIGIYQYTNSGSGLFNMVINWSTGLEGFIKNPDPDFTYPAAYPLNYLSWDTAGGLKMSSVLGGWATESAYRRFPNIKAVTGGSIISTRMVSSSTAFSHVFIDYLTLSGVHKYQDIDTSAVNPKMVTVPSTIDTVPINGAYVYSIIPFINIHSTSSPMTFDKVELYGFTSVIAQYRISMSQVILMNVCPP